MNANVDSRETSRFDALAARWWDPEGDMKPLHALNPVRVEYIAQRAGGLPGKRVLDVGCGGGLLTEALAARGAKVTGLDMAAELLKVARLHLHETGREVDYEQGTAEDYAKENPGSFDVVTCLEMLEHVPKPSSVVAACAKLVRPGGGVFFSTLNRTVLSFGLGIVAAEYVLNLLPKGTHTYEQFIKPSELSAWCRAAGLDVADMTGLHYNPVIRRAWSGGSIQVNYLLHAKRPEDA